MKCLDFDWQINEFMVYCRSTQLREKSMMAYPLGATGSARQLSLCRQLSPCHTLFFQRPMI